MFSPQDAGLPAKYTEWRDGQERIITNMLYSKQRYHVAVVPTGGGKTVCYMTVALMDPGRTLILTSTKGLQDQIIRDFGSKVAVVKGKSAYKCRASGDVYFCHTGSCRWGYKCPHKDTDCRYHKAIRDGLKAKIVVSNYSFWMANRPDVLGDFTILVLDEAHDAAEQLLGNMSMAVRRDEVSGIVPFPRKTDTNQGSLYAWAKNLRHNVNDLVKKGKGGERGKVRYLNLQTKLMLLDLIFIDNWVVENKGGEITFDAIWPTQLAGPYLFRGVTKVILTSAFITRMDLRMMGIEDKFSEYIEYPSTFPVENRMVYHIPTIRMDRWITEAGMNAWAMRIDAIIRSRFGWKGLIHTGSYERAQRISGFSQYRDFILTHKDGKGTEDVVRQFKESDPPRTLVSPSVTTGYDFPGDEANWQIISKVPFPDSRPLVMKARQAKDKDYGTYMALKQMVQASGRIVRSPTDVGETFILDNHFQWVFGKYRGVLPKWWVDSVKIVNTIPERKVM